jgi:rfaE bifunctional protein kinase chain/domain
MSPARFQAITEKYPALRIAIVGDFCLDRYLEIDPGQQEISIETNLPVHNVVNVRSQPGGAGTILNNLVALGVGHIYPVGFCGTDGEGFELQRALGAKGSSVHLDHFFATDARRTFTYCKPLLIHPGKAPEELSRLDSKNWTATPALVQDRILNAVQELAPKVDAMILLDQVDVPETGVITSTLLKAVSCLTQKRPQMWILADSRRGLRDYPPVCLKMNRAELAALTGAKSDQRLSLEELNRTVAALAQRHGRNVFITLSELGILGASPIGEVEYVSAPPVRGEIDIVGAGDAVTANLTAALAAGATLRECLQLANAAASIVIHQLGTTGTASVAQIRSLVSG